VRAVVAAVIAVSAAAAPATAAPNLGTIWTRARWCSNALHATGDSVVVVHDKQIARVARDTGKDRAPFAVPHAKGKAFVAAASKDLIVVTDAYGVTVLDAATGKAKWSLESLADDTVDRVAIGSAHLFVAVRLTKTTGTSVRAFALADHKQAWAVDVTDAHVALAALGDDALVGGAQLTAIAGATGKSTAIGTAGATAIATAAGHAYALDSATPANLVAIDVANHKLAWSHPTAKDKTVTLVGATVHGPVVREGDDVYREYAAADGSELEHLFAGQLQRVIAVDGTPRLFGCDGDKLTAIDDVGGAAAADETATITGRIQCTNCGAGERFSVTAAGVTADTDDHGAFSLQIAAHGTVAVTAVLTAGEAPVDLGTVRLAGKRSYDLGTVTVQAPDGE
jgi:hypothetical protein